MRILVTGGTGLIGRNLALELKKQGHDVLITGTNAKHCPPEFEGKLLLPSFIGLDWDRIGKIDVLYHQMAINDNQYKDRSEVFRINLESSKELFKRVVANGCKRIVYASTTAVYGMTPPPYKESMPVAPMNPYAESKAELEKWAIEFNKEYPDVIIVGLRYCNVYGSGEYHKGTLSTMIYQFPHQMLKGNPRLFKHGEQKRDYIYVKDVVKANLLAAKAKESCVVNCGSGSATSFNDMIKILNKVMGLSRTPEYIDNPFKDNYQDYTECDMTLAKEKIGFVPDFDIRKGIKDYYDSGELLKRAL